MTPKRVQPQPSVPPPEISTPPEAPRFTPSPFPDQSANKGPVRPRELTPRDYLEQERQEREAPRPAPPPPPPQPVQPRVIPREEYRGERAPYLSPTPRAGDGWSMESDEDLRPQRYGGRSAAAPGITAHKVEAGETLTGIARDHFGYGGPRTIDAILAVNPGLHPDRIYIGQIIYLPMKVQEPPEPLTPPTPVKYKGKTTGANMSLVPVASKAKRE